MTRGPKDVKPRDARTERIEREIQMTLRNRILIAAGTVLTAAGCSDRSAMNEFFPPEQRSTHAFAAAHADAGARNDATLQAHHFDGGELNATGREKLDQMMAPRAGGAAAPTTVYLNVTGERTDARRASALAYLGEIGIDEDAVKIVNGPNPNLKSPAAGHISRMNRTEGQATEPGGGNEESAPSFMPDAMTDK